MFDTVRKNQKIVQIVLALIVLPFAFWGVESYIRNVGTDDAAATVGGSKISVAEFQQALREQQERLRPALGGRVDPALLESPELRRSVLDSLATRRLLVMSAVKSHLTISDAQLAGFIAAVPSLQENGQFSPARYEMVIASQGLSKPAFEANVRQDLLIQQPMMAVADASHAAGSGARRWLAAQLEGREVAEALLRAEQFLDKVQITPDAVKTFYETNQKRFEIPEQLTAEYVVLSRDRLLEQAAVGDDEARAWYQSHPDRYRQGEERRAAHILLRMDKGADVKATEAKAADLLAQLRRSPAEFARLARQHSQDPGSAEKGGDLDWFGRGMMVKPFEEAVFGLTQGQVSEVVRSEFGLHIIMLTGVRPERARPFEEVRGEIVAELKAQAAAKKYQEMVEGFSNTVYEQADSLQPAAEKYKLAIARSDWLARGGSSLPPLNNPKLMAALFSEDAIKNKRNTEAVEVAPNVMVAARVLEHKPAQVPGLEVVGETIRKLLAHQEAAKLAAKEGEALLARLRQGETPSLSWSSPQTQVRALAKAMPPAVRQAIFATDVARLPAYGGAAVPAGYAIYRIGQVKAHDAQGGDEQQARGLRAQYARIIADEELTAWIAALKTRYPVVVNTAVLERKDR